MSPREDQRALEERACREGLDRLQEAAIAGIVDELADRRLSRLDLQRLRADLLKTVETNVKGRADREASDKAKEKTNVF